MPRKRKPYPRLWTWGGVVTVLVPLSTLALVLLGYGYTLAVDAIFGIDAALVAHSLPEYLQLSSHVIVHLLSAVSEAVRQQQTYARLYENSLPWLGIGGAAWLLFFMVWSPRAWWGNKINAAFRRGRRVTITYLRKISMWPSPVQRGSRWVLLHLMKLPQQITKLPRTVWWALGSLAFISGWPLLTLGLTVAAVILIGYLFGLLPLVGYAVAHSSLQKWVVTPAECIEVRSRDQILVDQLPLPSDTVLVPGARCVCVEKDGEEIARGRLVVATAEAVILFEPLSGRTRRVAIGDAIIRPVGSLD